MFEKRDDAGRCIRAEEFCGEEATWVYTSPVCIWPEPAGTRNFFPKWGEVNTHSVAGESVLAAGAGRVYTPAAEQPGSVQNRDTWSRDLTLRSCWDLALLGCFGVLDLKTR